MRRIAAIGILIILSSALCIPLLASSVTEAGTPERSPSLFPGLQNEALRYFDPSGDRLFGTANFFFAVLEFDSTGHARTAMPNVFDGLQASMDDGVDLSELRQASIRKIGDETLAYAGEMTSPKSDDKSGRKGAQIAIVIARKGNVIHIGWGGAILGDPLTDVASVLQTTIHREPSTNPISTNADGMHEGGIWDALPTLDDLPEGFVFEVDQEHGIFDRASPLASPAPSPSR